jgi:hypothetical protein
MHRLWSRIKNRCYFAGSTNFRDYGGRGIRMWSGWAESFECFEADILSTIGPHPGEGWSLDRIDNDGDYVPGNLRWATRSQQQRNTRRSLHYGIGSQFGDWTVVAEVPRQPDQPGRNRVLVRCRCQVEKVVRVDNFFRHPRPCSHAR